MAEATETIPIYPWFDQKPANLKTRAQLATERLKLNGLVRPVTFRWAVQRKQQ